jgi:5-methylcytosine-specific restriction enzyme A
MGKLQMLKPRLTVGPSTRLNVQSSTGWVGSEKSTALYDRKWRREREEFFLKHPLCKHCLEEGKVEPAVELDHIIPHRGDLEIFNDPNNRQGLCKSHHSKKTARENGGFGNI